jgi:hypothetical protein
VWVHSQQPNSELSLCVSEGSLVHANVSLGVGCSLRQTFISRDVVVGPGAKICCSILLSGAVVEANADVQYCIVGPGVCIRQNAVACCNIFGAGVAVSADQRVPPFLSFTTAPVVDPFHSSGASSDAAGTLQHSHAYLGPSGVGRVWPSKDDVDVGDADSDDDDDEAYDADDNEGGFAKATTAAHMLQTAAAVSSESLSAACKGVHAELIDVTQKLSDAHTGQDNFQRWKECVSAVAKLQRTVRLFA